MIWESVPLMTVIDLSIIFVCILALVAYWEFRVPIHELGARIPTLLCILGLTVMAGLYLADLYTMHVLPLYDSHERAMQAMAQLHLNWSWLISFVGLGSLSIGTLLLIRALFPALARHERQLREEIDSHLATEKELRESQGELIRQERLATLGMLTATVSHELRNPLGTIQNATHVIQQRLHSSTAVDERSVDMIIRNVERCNDIVESLLIFGKSRQLNLSPTPIDPWCTEILDEYPWPDHVSVHRNLGANVEVNIDREQMRAALTNVIRNACDAMLMLRGDESVSPTGRLALTTAARAGRVEIVVENNGASIDPETRSKIMKPLFSTKPFGMGLGLSIANRAMEVHSGAIEFDNRPDEGVRVVLWIPHPAATTANEEETV